MRYWDTLPPEQKIELMRLYSSQGFSYKDAIEDFERGIAGMYQEGGIVETGVPQTPDINSTPSNQQVNLEDLIKVKQTEMEELFKYIGQDPLTDLDIAVELEIKNREIGEYYTLMSTLSENSTSYMPEGNSSNYNESMGKSSTTPTINSYAEGGIVTSEGDEKDKKEGTNGKVGEGSVAIKEILDGEGKRMPIVVYDEKKARDFKFTGGNFYIPYHATKELIDAKYSYEDIFSIVMANRDVYEDYHLSRYNYAFNNIIVPASKKAIQNYKNAMGNGTISKTDKMLYDYNEYIEKQYNAQTVEEKKKILDEYRGKYKDSFFERTDPLFASNPEMADMLFESRDKLEPIRYNTEGTGDKADAFGVRSMSFFERPQKKFGVYADYEDRRYIGKPRMYSMIAEGVYNVKYDPDTDNVYYTISQFDTGGDYLRALGTLRTSPFAVDERSYEYQLVNSAKKEMEGIREAYKSNIQKNPTRYLPVGKEVKVELMPNEGNNLED